MECSLAPASISWAAPSQLLQVLPQYLDFGSRVVGRPSVDWAWEHVGGIVRYQPQHMAALAQLPYLRVLECTVPTVCQPEHQVKWLAAVATLTQLTALHIIQGDHHPRWPLPAGQLSQLSSLTALRNLSTDAGAPADVCWAGEGLPGEAERQAQAQAQQWGIALAGMPHLTRLELVRVLLCDVLLKTIGSKAPQLRELLLDLSHNGFAAATSAAGAAAIAHIPRMELAWHKSPSCKHNMALMRLSNLNVMRSKFRGVAERRDGVWSADTCICNSCLTRKRLERGRQAMLAVEAAEAAAFAGGAIP
ncbi:hypothetical protein OEZ86_013546 [Tetradesmus obliquus]|nr:hypothetical protein OEZ86_013546 [Tetradesmus obliquus]